MRFTDRQNTYRPTPGQLMASERLVYRYRIHRKCRLAYEQVPKVCATQVGEEMYLQPSLCFWHCILQSGVSAQNLCGTQTYNSGEQKTIHRCDINNSAGKSIKVKEFKGDVSENSQSGNIRCPARTKAMSTTIAGNDTARSPNKTCTFNLSDIDVDVKRRFRAVKFCSRADLYQFEKVNENSICTLLEQVREAQRSVRRKIREIEKQLEATVDQDVSRSNAIMAVFEEISRLKSVVIQEACDFEDSFQLKAKKDVDKSKLANIQLNRIKCVSILSKCERDLAYFTEGLEKEYKQSVDSLQREIHQLDQTMNELSEQRKDLVRLTVTSDSTEDNEGLSSDDSAFKHDQRSSIYTKDIDFDHDFKIDVNVRKSYLNGVKSGFRFNNVGKTDAVSDVVSHIVSLPSTQVNRHDDKVPAVDLKDSETQLSDSQRDLVQRLRKKWEKLDKEYHIHSKKISKEKDMSRSSAGSEQDVEYKSGGSMFSECSPLKFSLGIPTLRSSNILTGTLGTFEASLIDIGLHAGENMDRISRNIKENYAYQILEKKYSSFDNSFFQNILLLRSRIDDICKLMKLTWTSIKKSVDKTRLQAMNSLNLFSQRVTNIKRKLKRPRRPRDREIADDDISVFCKVRDHILIFFRRLKLVAKFRNVLMFDREILLPKKRFSLMEWYDLPMAVVYGMERLDSDEVISRSRLSPRTQGENECRFDLRVYGPMEYQLGRALNLNEQALLQEEKIALLRNTHYDRKRKLARRTLIDMSELDENACLSCLRCLKDCLFGCQNNRKFLDSDQETRKVDYTEHDVAAASRNIPVGTHYVDSLPMYTASGSHFFPPASRLPGIEIRKPEMTKESMVEDIDDQRRFSHKRHSRSPSPFNDHDEIRKRGASRVRWRDEMPSNSRSVDY